MLEVIRHFHCISIATGMVSHAESFENTNLYIAKTAPFHVCHDKLS